MKIGFRAPLLSLFNPYHHTVSWNQVFGGDFRRKQALKYLLVPLTGGTRKLCLSVAVKSNLNRLIGQVKIHSKTIRVKEIRP